MSYLNPPAATPALCIDLTDLASLRDLRPAAGAPDVAEAAMLAEAAGADRIALSLRSDAGAQWQADVIAISARLPGGCDLALPLHAEMLALAAELTPHSLRLVGDQADGGSIDVVQHGAAIRLALQHLRERPVVAMLMIDADTAQIQAAVDTGVAAVMLNTAPYAMAGDAAQASVQWERLANAAIAAARLGLQVQAGGFLDYRNVGRIAAIDALTQVNVGHAVLARAVFAGWSKAVSEMKSIVAQARHLDTGKA
jgi:pyridoxine 5-phosphate synthase